MVSVLQLNALCNSIYTQLGPSHSECVYQTALVLELYNLSAKSVESEKHVPVFYIDSNNTQHTIGSERIDILVRFDTGVIFLIELKAVANMNKQNVEQQINKYEKSLHTLNIFPTYKIAVNFPQQLDKKEVDFVHII
tara:strand:+ start:21869 stop:22279 length:411 start_codon:yes stop_codon:yes gene_type:complete